MVSQSFDHIRRTYLVERRFQIGFILKFCLLVLAGVLVSTALVILFTKGTLTSTFENSRLSIKSTASVILPVILYTNLITLGLVSLATIIVTLFVSHRIAGPLYRLEKELHAIGQGELNRKISLRKKDQVTALARSLNEATDRLRGKLVEVKRQLEELYRIGNEKDLPKDVLARIDQLRSYMDGNFNLR